MTARVQRSFDFMACVQFQTEFYANYYEFDAFLNVETESIEEQNIALERIKYFLDFCLQHSIFVRDTDTQSIEKFVDAGLRICTLPEDPYDQIIGIMLLNKLNAITEGRLIVTDISITSRLSDGVTCFYDIEESSGPFNNQGWWKDNSFKLNDVKMKGKKIIKLTKTYEWDELGLAWETKKVDEKDSNQVVFVNFDKVDK
jgi:hypothetical protein